MTKTTTTVTTTTNCSAPQTRTGIDIVSIHTKGFAVKVSVNERTIRHAIVRDVAVGVVLKHPVLRLPGIIQ